MEEGRGNESGLVGGDGPSERTALASGHATRSSGRLSAHAGREEEGMVGRGAGHEEGEGRMSPSAIFLLGIPFSIFHK